MLFGVYVNTKAIILRSLLGKFVKVFRKKVYVHPTNCRAFPPSIELSAAIDELFSTMMEPLLVCSSLICLQSRSWFFSSIACLELDSDFDSRDGSDDENENSIKSEVSDEQKYFSEDIIRLSLTAKSSVFFHCIALN